MTTEPREMTTNDDPLEHAIVLNPDVCETCDQHVLDCGCEEWDERLAELNFGQEDF